MKLYNIGAATPTNRTMQQLIRVSISLYLIVYLGALQAHADDGTASGAQQTAKQTYLPGFWPEGFHYDDFSDFMRWLDKRTKTTNNLEQPDEGQSSDEGNLEGADEGAEAGADDHHHDGDSAKHKIIDDSRPHDHGAHGPGHASGSGGRQSDQHCLAAHNKIRRMHRVDELQWDAELAHVARKHSERLARAGRGLENSLGSKYGENVFMHSTANASCEFGVQLWYDELRQYSYKNPMASIETCHFTQLVWRSTRRVGCAFASSRGGTYLTCNYDPKGNEPGEFEQNVPPPVAKTSGSLISVYSSRDEGVGESGSDMTRGEAETLNLIELIDHDWLGALYK